MIATARAEDADFLRDLGAAQVIDYKAGPFERDMAPVDLVYDLVNGETQDRSWQVLKDGGAMISTLRDPAPDKAAERHARAAHYMAHPDGGQLEEIRRLVEAGEVTPVVARTYPLAAAADAERELEHEHVRGKIVLQVG